MAEVPYQAGQEAVTPASAPPDDYQRIQTSPAAFGAGIAKGVQSVGQGASEIGNFWGEVQVDGQLNTTQEKLNALVTHIKTLQGQDALDAQKGALDQVKQIINEGKSGLALPSQQLRFDNSIRPFADRFITGQLDTHFDQQAKIHSTTVNNAAMTIALNNAATAADNPEQFEHFRQDARAAAIKQVQVEGNGGDKDIVAAALRKADQAAYKTQIEAVRAKDPVRAQQLIEQHKNELGEMYAPLAEQVRAQAEAANDAASAKQFIEQTKPQTTGARAQAAHIFTQAALGAPGGFSPEGLARTAQIESSGNAGITNHAGMKGLMQFSDPTWATYGKGSPFNPADAALAAQKYAAANARVLTPVLGRAPTDAELYLAHQQGGGGAAKLFANPNVRAGDLVGDKAIVQNGGDPNAPASAFTSMWISKFNKTPQVNSILYDNRTMTLPAAAATAGAPTTPEQPYFTPPPSAPEPTPEMAALRNNDAMAPGPLSPGFASPAVDQEQHEAEAIRAAMNSDRSDLEKKRIVANIRFEFAQAAMASESTLQARKKIDSDRTGQYVDAFAKMRSSANPNYESLYNSILADQSLLPETRLSLGKKLREISGEPDQSDFGPKWQEVRNRMMLPPDDPQHMTYQDAIAAPGVTSKGMEELTKVQKQNREGIGGAVITHATNQALKYAGDVMKLEQGFGDNLKIPNLRGQRIFDGAVAPYIIETVDEMASRGARREIDDFLKPENLDKVVNRFYDRKQRAQDVLLGGAQAAQKPAAPEPIPPPPATLEGKISVPDWNRILSQPPVTVSGAPMSREAFANVISMLMKNPTPETKRAFDESQFGRAGLRAQQIINRVQSHDIPQGVMDEVLRRGQE